MHRLLLLTLLVAVPVAHASEAEIKRLQTELHTLARRSTWTGVDRTYRALVDLGVPLAGADHLAGYQAALQQGEPLLALYRVSRVTASEGEEDSWNEAQRVRTTLTEQYGLVAFVVPEGREPTLERLQMPFAPDQRAAIERATVLLKERRELRTLLPIGRYLVAGEPFDVAGGESWQTLVVD